MARASSTVAVDGTVSLTAQTAEGRRLSVKIEGVTRKKTTVYIDETLLRAAKVAAARSGKHEYQVFEEALREHLGLGGALARIWAGIPPDAAPSEEEAAQIAAEEIAAMRAERSPARAG